MKKPNPAPAVIVEEQRQSRGPSIAVVSAPPAGTPARVTLEEALPLAGAVIRCALAVQELQDAVRGHVHDYGDSATTVTLKRIMPLQLGPVAALQLVRTMLEEVER